MSKFINQMVKNLETKRERRAKQSTTGKYD